MNYIAVLVAGVASMVIGSIWYGPLFGKPFMRAMGMDSLSPERKEAEKKKMVKFYLVQFIASLVMFFTVSWLISELGKMTLAGGLEIGFCVWLGIVVPVQLGNAIWGGKMSLFWISAGNMLVTLLAAGAIIGAWV